MFLHPIFSILSAYRTIDHQILKDRLLYYCLTSQYDLRKSQHCFYCLFSTMVKPIVIHHLEKVIGSNIIHQMNQSIYTNANQIQKLIISKLKISIMSFNVFLNKRFTRVQNLTKRSTTSCRQRICAKIPTIFAKIINIYFLNHLISSHSSIT